MRARKHARRFGAIAIVGCLALVLSGCDETTITSPIHYSCQIKTTGLPNVTGTFDASYDTTAPQAVGPAGEFVVDVAPQPFLVDGTPTANGTVTQISAIVFKVNVPANATLTGQSISGGTNIGPGTPTVSGSGNTVTLSVPGPMPSNTNITLPTVRLELTATGALGSRVQPKVAGTSFTSPGLTFSTRVTGTLFGTINPAFSCFPDPSPNLHSVLISNDVAPPTITITSPTANQSIVRNSTVLAGYTCDDGAGTGVQSCTGTVPNGAAIDTATLGAHTFTVTAVDNQGLTKTKSVDYTVVAP